MTATNFLSLCKQIASNLRLPGQYADSETGLCYNWNRYYDPVTGRYTTKDPIGLGGGINNFVYTQSSPFYLIDSNGLWSMVGEVSGSLIAGAGVKGSTGYWGTTGGDSSNYDAGVSGTVGAGVGLEIGAGVGFSVLSGGRENIDGGMIVTTWGIPAVSVSLLVSPSSHELVGIGFSVGIENIYGIPAAASASYTNTSTLSVRDILDKMKRQTPRVEPKQPEIHPCY